jgi:peptidoglycan hydrolase-like protein with peptidoglycan-binding domain
MPNPGQPTISPGATGDPVRRAQRALRRTPEPSLVVDGSFGPATEHAVKSFQEGSPGLTVDGIVGPATWSALPDGAPMPVLRDGSSGDVVRRLQEVLANGSGQWNTGPGAVDGEFGPHTRTSVEAFQKWGGITADGVVGDQTWDVSLHAMMADLETEVGLEYANG